MENSAVWNTQFCENAEQRRPHLNFFKKLSNYFMYPTRATWHHYIYVTFTGLFSDFFPKVPLTTDMRSVPLGFLGASWQVSIIYLKSHVLHLKLAYTLNSTEE